MQDLKFTNSKAYTTQTTDHQPKDYAKSGEIIFIAQSEDIEEGKAWDFSEIQKENLPPEGFQWLLCNEKSEYFHCTFNNESMSPIAGIMGVSEYNGEGQEE